MPASHSRVTTTATRRVLVRTPCLQHPLCTQWGVIVLNALAVIARQLTGHTGQEHCADNGVNDTSSWHRDAGSTLPGGAPLYRLSRGLVGYRNHPTGGAVFAGGTSGNQPYPLTTPPDRPSHHYWRAPLSLFKHPSSPGTRPGMNVHTASTCTRPGMTGDERGRRGRGSRSLRRDSTPPSL